MIKTNVTRGLGLALVTLGMAAGLAAPTAVNASGTDAGAAAQAQPAATTTRGAVAQGDQTAASTSSAPTSTGVTGDAAAAKPAGAIDETGAAAAATADPAAKPAAQADDAGTQQALAKTAPAAANPSKAPSATPASAPLINTYATVIKGRMAFWRSLNWDKAGKTSDDYLNQTLVAVARVTLANGNPFYQLATAKGEVVGYINATALAITDQPGGVAQPFGRYATITTTANAKIWGDLSFKTVAAMAPDVFQQTFLAKTVSHHVNGADYYALYRDGQLFGYINAATVKTAATQAGVAVSVDKYATTTSKARYAIWKGFEWKNKAGATDATKPKTYEVRYAYHHASGAVYYSLYRANKWQGYVNAKAMTLADTARGAALPTDQIVSVTETGLKVWTDLAMHTKLTDTRTVLNRTYRVTQRFVSEAGPEYFQLTDGKGQPQGYVNATAVTKAAGEQGRPVSDSREVLLKTNYKLWRNFDWLALAKQAASYQGQALQVRCYYNHLNGSRYASLYTLGGQWVGYVNEKGLTPAGVWRPVSGQLRYYDNLKDRYTKTYAVTYFSQLDARWAKKNYGGYAFGPSGCGMASMAMVLAGYGRAVTPITTADYGYKYADFDRDGAGTNQETLTTVATRFGLDWKVMASSAELISYLKQGYPATVCLDLGGYRHIVVLHGYANGKTTVSDPYANRLYTGKHTIADVWSKLSWLQGNREMGASAAIVYFAR
ncbi:C39 family peptidase [Lacticaseibacillus kribbianus]|uniref:C39 family peptidase n=1 Tax=Lacticaseibacillus kribbianus TaxID=2926292 RepID=UPI001CD722EE|nr:C39 family peptidase [Lacticaseibacillus kribbianus]